MFSAFTYFKKHAAQSLALAMLLRRQNPKELREPRRRPVQTDLAHFGDAFYSQSAFTLASGTSVRATCSYVIKKTKADSSGVPALRRGGVKCATFSRPKNCQSLSRRTRESAT